MDPESGRCTQVKLYLFSQVFFQAHLNLELQPYIIFKKTKSYPVIFKKKTFKKYLHKIWKISYKILFVLTKSDIDLLGNNNIFLQKKIWRCIFDEKKCIFLKKNSTSLKYFHFQGYLSSLNNAKCLVSLAKCKKVLNPYTRTVTESDVGEGLVCVFVWVEASPGSGCYIISKEIVTFHLIWQFFIYNS